MHGCLLPQVLQFDYHRRYHNISSNTAIKQCLASSRNVLPYTWPYVLSDASGYAMQTEEVM